MSSNLTPKVQIQQFHSLDLWKTLNFQLFKGKAVKIIKSFFDVILTINVKTY